MSFPAYLDYKASEVEWLGQVPLHWEVDRFKHSTVSCKNGIWGKEAQGDENDIACVRVADFDRESLTTVEEIPTVRNVSESERSERTLSKGNLLLEKSGGGDLQPVGFVVLYDRDEPAVCSNFVAKVQLAEGMVPSFWRYCHAAAYAVRLNYKSIKQTSGIQNLDQSQYLDERAPFPPEDEQKAISSFLDVETSKIDGLVSEQRRLIELLKEKRQAVISHAVTKGLNPNAPMKPSGIQWLGDVPQHWPVTRLSYFATVENGSTPSRNIEQYWKDGAVPWLSSGEVNQYRVRKPAELITELALAECPLRLLPKRTIVVGMIGQGKTRGLAAILEIEATINQNLAAIVPSERLDSAYLHFLFEPAYEYLRMFGRGGNQAALNCEILKAVRIPVPPVDEQREICHYVERNLMTFDELTQDAERAIKLLQERRTALISAAVTGKIDVRQFAPQEGRGTNQVSRKKVESAVE